MQLTIKKKIGKRDYSFMVEGSTFHEVIMESEKLSFNDVFECGLCKSDNLTLTAYETKEDKFQYTKVLCLKCKASLTFGQRKKGDVFYLRRTEAGNYDWKEYKGKDNESSSDVSEGIKNKPDDDMPF